MTISLLPIATVTAPSIAIFLAIFYLTYKTNFLFSFGAMILSSIMIIFLTDLGLSSEAQDFNESFSFGVFSAIFTVFPVLLIAALSGIKKEATDSFSDFLRRLRPLILLMAIGCISSLLISLYKGKLFDYTLLGFILMSFVYLSISYLNEKKTKGKTIKQK